MVNENVDKKELIYREQKGEDGLEYLRMGLAQTAKATLKKENLLHDNVIPYDSLYKENDEYYVYTMETVQEMWGKTYTVKKKKVHVDHYNNEYIGLAQGINPANWVVITSEVENPEVSKE